MLSRNSNERILLVDDEKMVTDAVGMMLQYYGFQVTTKNDSKDALAMFQASPGEFDLVMTDYAMPEMSGTGLAVELIGIRPDIPIILYTGNSAGISAETIKEIGFRAVITKPQEMTQLAQTVRNVLDENDVEQIF